MTTTGIPGDDLREIYDVARAALAGCRHTGVLEILTESGRTYPMTLETTFAELAQMMVDGGDARVDAVQ